MSWPQNGDGVGAALNDETRGGAADCTLMVRAVCVTGFRTVNESVISATPYTGPFALAVGTRVSPATLSDRPSVGVPQSHQETTRLRSTPAGRGGGVLGASPA